MESEQNLPPNLKRERNKILDAVQHFLATRNLNKKIILLDVVYSRIDVTIWFECDPQLLGLLAECTFHPICKRIRDWNNLYVCMYTVSTAFGNLEKHWRRMIFCVEASEGSLVPSKFGVVLTEKKSTKRGKHTHFSTSLKVVVASSGGSERKVGWWLIGTIRTCPPPGTGNSSLIRGSDDVVSGSPPFVKET